MRVLQLGYRSVFIFDLVDALQDKGKILPRYVSRPVWVIRGTGVSGGSVPERWRRKSWLEGYEEEMKIKEEGRGKRDE